MNRLHRASGALLATIALFPSVAGCQAPPLGSTRADVLHEAATTAWQYVENHTNPATGLVSATPNYGNATTWDLGSGLAAVYSAHELGIIDDAEYDRRMGKMLATLKALPLYDGVAYHKVYSVADGSLVNDQGHPSGRGYAWSATDLGRFLLWLAIIERADPDHAALAREVAQRMDPSRVIREGYLWGEDRTRKSPFLEGRIGYEQYAARGFQAWGWNADKALNIMTNAQPVQVMGHTIYKDGRGLDRVLSEPFVLMGLETGWDDSTAVIAERLLAIQKARYDQTGQVTMVSEDAVEVPPHYFYYYCIYCNGEPFVVDIHTPGNTLDEPRWVSTKATMGWHALLPSEYTELALETIYPARTPRGWQSGVFEGTQKPTGTLDVNTAAVVLEAALYARRGEPLLPPR